MLLLPLGDFFLLWLHNAVQVAVLIDDQQIPVALRPAAIVHSPARQVAVFIHGMIIGIDGQHRAVGLGDHLPRHRLDGVIAEGHGRAQLPRLGDGDHRVQIARIVDAPAGIHLHRQGGILILGIGKVVLFSRRGGGAVHIQRRHIRLGA